jgi:hypothetical protein
MVSWDTQNIPTPHLQSFGYEGIWKAFVDIYTLCNKLNFMLWFSFSDISRNFELRLLPTTLFQANTALVHVDMDYTPLSCVPTRPPRCNALCAGAQTTNCCQYGSTPECTASAVVC